MVHYKRDNKSQRLIVPTVVDGHNLLVWVSLRWFFAIGLTVKNVKMKLYCFWIWITYVYF